MQIKPPENIAELKERAQALAGLTLGELANELALDIPTSLLRAKGWIGQLLEKALGATAKNLDEPDFLTLGVELKTLPISSQGLPIESTYVCAITLPFVENNWHTSRVYRKLKHVLWVPIEFHSTLAIKNRRIGNALLWSPDFSLMAQLQRDWEELTELLTLGHFAELSAKKGVYLHVRPKAANSKTLVRTINESGQSILTVPKGFYLRTTFTQTILQLHYA